MDVTTVTVIAAAVFVWGVVSARLERADLTAPIVFVAVGVALAALGTIDTPSAPESLKPLVEVTLVWVLFSDAARIRVADLRHDLGRCVRLLGLGLPLTILLGWALAVWLLPGLDLWLALLVAAALAPTDAALGVPVVTNRAVPSRIRRLITVESGLNDGIATPVVVLAIAGAASRGGTGRRRPGAGAARAGDRGGRRRRGGRRGRWPAAVGASTGVGGRGVRRHRGPRPRSRRLLRRTPRARERLRRRVLRRAGVRGRGGPARARGGRLPGAGEWPGLPARVAGVRGRGRADHAREPRPGRGALRRAEPDPGPHAPGRARPHRFRGRPGHGAVRGLVRPTGSRLARVRPARAGGTRSGRRSRRGRHRGDRAAERRRARRQCRSPRCSVRRVPCRRGRARGARRRPMCPFAGYQAVGPRSRRPTTAPGLPIGERPSTPSPPGCSPRRPPCTSRGTPHLRIRGGAEGDQPDASETEAIPRPGSTCRGRGGRAQVQSAVVRRTGYAVAKAPRVALGRTPENERCQVR